MLTPDGRLLRVFGIHIHKTQILEIPILHCNEYPEF